MFQDPMGKYDIRMPMDLWARTKEKAEQLSAKAGRRITGSDLVRTALEKLLKEI